MKQEHPKVSLDAESLNVVILPPAPKLKGEWLFLFRQFLTQLPTTLSPAGKAVLLDLIALGSVSPHGFLCTPVSALLSNGVSRTTVYRALEALKELDLIVGPTKGMVYLSPKLIYRGHTRDWGMAMHYWRYLGGKHED
jgi:hypothetical protein